MDRISSVFVAVTMISGAVLLTRGLPFLGGLLVAVAAFSLLWIVSLALRNASIVDVFWGAGFILVGGYYLAVIPGAPTPRGLLVAGFMALWGVRLALHIGVRNAGAGEDFRYRAWREEAGPSFWWVSYFKVFLLQAVVLWIVSSPLLLALVEGSRSQLSALDLLGGMVFLGGFLFESVADWQLARFKRDPGNSGRILTSGLWSRSRHPNYFGEALLWWGLGLLALPTGGLVALIGPVMITFLLVKVSGVAMLDAALVDRRHGYAEYIRSTPAFFPRLGRVDWASRSGSGR